MAVGKVLPEGTSNKKYQMAEDQWIDKNFKIACDFKFGSSEYVDRFGESTNSHEFEKVKLALSHLAEINYNSALLTTLGEKVKSAGGWISYKDQKDIEEQNEKEQEAIIKQLQYDNLDMQNESLKYQQTIRDQEQRIRNLEEQNQFLSLLQKYWWAISISIGIGIGLRELLDIALQ